MRSFFFISILFLTSCHIKTNTPNKMINSNIVYDENDSIPQLKIADNTLIYPEIFEGAFLSGSEVKQWGFIMKFYCKKIGEIKIPSGKIIAEDPVTLNEDSKPYIYKFPTGNYPIELARLINPEGYESNAFARIKFSSNKISKWEYALLENQKQIPITNLDGYGYGVDAGIGLFIDQEAVIEFSKILLEKWEYLFIDQFEDQYLIYEFGKHNVATFSTGAGDGFYRTYVGFDGDNNICQLLTDFELVKWW